MYGLMKFVCRSGRRLPGRKKLSSVYHELLGWKEAELFGNPGLSVKTASCLCLWQEDDYVPPVWPEEEGRQQKQVHF